MEVEQGALAHVGIADEGHADKAAAVFALRVLLALDVGQTLLEQGHAVEDDAAVHLELRLARSAQSDGAFAATAA